MAGLGKLIFSLCTEGIMPATPDEEFRVLGEPGMSPQAALFFAPRWKPQRMVFFHGVASETAARDLCVKIRALRRQYVDADDGQTVFANSLVLIAQGTWRDAGQVIGPGLVGCRYEISIMALILPAAV